MGIFDYDCHGATDASSLDIGYAENGRAARVDLEGSIHEERETGKETDAWWL
jgi:hypothetical protein